jgi:hypothetical protein
LGGEFGDEYINRNKNRSAISSNLALFSIALSRTSGIHSCIEFGANIGLNLIALKKSIPRNRFIRNRDQRKCRKKIMQNSSKRQYFP